MAKKKLSIVPTSDLSNELERRGRRLPRLQRKREQILAQLRGVEDEIEDLGGLSGKGPGRKKKAAVAKKRPRNEMSLGDALEKVLKGRKTPAGVKELAEAVQKLGYKSNSASFSTIVNQALLKDDRFQQAGRGQYTLAG